MAILVTDLIASSSAAQAPQDPSAPKANGQPVVAPVVELLLDDAKLTSFVVAHNLEVAAARAQVAQARADLAQAGVFPNPSFETDIMNLPVGRTNPPDLPLSKAVITSFQIAETVEIGKRGPRIDAARLRLQAQEANYFDTVARTVADARLALGRLVYLHARQAVLDETLADARKVLELEAKRVEHGDLSGNDYDRLLVDTMEIEAEAAHNQSELDTAFHSCRAILAAQCEIKSLDYIGTLRNAAPLPDMPKDPEVVLSTRPDIRALELTQEAAKKDALLARRKAIPDPALGIGFTHDQFTVSGDNPNYFSLSLTIPIPAFDHGQHEAARALAQAMELARRRDAVVASAKADLASQQRRMKFLQDTLENLTSKALPKSKAVLESTGAALHRGQVSMTELLLARRTYTGLQLKVIDLEFELFSVRNEIRRTLGTDGRLAWESTGYPEQRRQ
jgi:cobalt-zinc-cadmium efflux system outer membrane protein